MTRGIYSGIGGVRSPCSAIALTAKCCIALESNKARVGKESSMFFLYILGLHDVKMAGNVYGDGLVSGTARSSACWNWPKAVRQQMLYFNRILPTKAKLFPSNYGTMPSICKRDARMADTIAFLQLSTLVSTIHLVCSLTPDRAIARSQQ